MPKIDRYAGNVRAFGADATGFERTIFGSETQANDLDSNINLSFLRGWGIVGVNENPTKQDFNAAFYTLGQLIAYLHQMGVPEWEPTQEVFAGSVVTTAEGIYRLKSGGDGSVDPDIDDGSNWEKASMGGGLIFSSVAALRDYGTPTRADAVARLIGYHTFGDGGGGPVRVWKDGEAPGTYVDNGGSVILPTGGDGSGAWVFEHSGPVNVKWFGAIGDGVTDDTVAVENAAALGSISVPLGVYLVGDITVQSFNLESAGATFLKKSGAAFIFDIDGGGPFVWENIAFDGQNTAGKAFEFANIDGITFDNVSAKNWIERPMIFDQSVTGVRINGGTVKDSTAPDMYVIKSTDNVISGVTFKNLQEHAIRFGRFNSGDLDQVSGNLSTVSGCYFEDVYSDPINCELDSQDVLITGNKYIRCRNIAKADLTGESDRLDRITITDNHFTQPKSHSFVSGITLAQCPNVTVTGNHIDLRDTIVAGVPATASRGIYHILENALVEGNILIGATTTSLIRIGSDSIASGNRITALGGMGIEVVGEDSVVAGNNIRTAGGRGVSLAESGCFVTGNKIDTGGLELGVRWVLAGDPIIVTNNDLRNTTGTTAAGSGSVVENNYV